jgi:RNA polymerase primary sigma factor
MSIKNEELIKKYEKLVDSLLRRMDIPNRMDYEDLKQEGYLGLLQAANRYKPNKKIKFITFAYYYIKGAMLRYVYANKYLEHVPVKHLEFAKIIRDYIKRNPTKELDKQDIITGTGLTERQVEKGLGIFSRTPDYAPLTYNEKEDSSFIKATEEVDRQILRKKLFRLCQLRLTERQREIVYKHYGLDDGEFKSFQDIANELGISVQRVHDCCATAIKKLHNRKEKLRDVYI